MVFDESDEYVNQSLNDYISSSHRRMSTVHSHTMLSEIFSLLSRNEEHFERFNSGILNYEGFQCYSPLLRKSL